MIKTTRPQTALILGCALAGLLSRPWMSHPATQDGHHQALGFSDALVRVSAEAAPGVVQVRTLGTSRRGLRTLQEGSGIIVQADGIVVTNNHVVENGKEFRVLLTDGVRRKALLLARDADADLAVLRILPEPGDGEFHALSLDTPAPAVGQVVMALGNPMGLGHSVTSGIVCGLGRSDLDLNIYEDFIQTDCVVNPGSSGGPLIDLSGRVVGITTAVGLKSNGDEGIAFAIPAAMVRKVVEDILEHGRVVRGWIGIEPHYWFNPESESGFEGISRVKIKAFTKDASSPAQKAGLKVGDIVTALDERRLVTRKDLMTAVAEKAPGDTVEVTIWRKGKTLKIPVKLSERATSK
ncbi:MAG: S1-C subfamily serine protease [Planctomycetota bacterium]|jgi:S1-C subfamily serine protease